MHDTPSLTLSQPPLLQAAVTPQSGCATKSSLAYLLGCVTPRPVFPFPNPPDLQRDPAHRTECGQPSIHVSPDPLATNLLVHISCLFPLTLQPLDVLLSFLGFSVLLGAATRTTPLKILATPTVRADFSLRLHVRSGFLAEEPCSLRSLRDPG